MRGYYCADCDLFMPEVEHQDSWTWDEFQGARFKHEEHWLVCPECDGLDIEEIFDLCPKCKKDRTYETFPYCHSCLPQNFLDDEMQDMLKSMREV